MFCWEKHPRSRWLAPQRALTRPCFSPQVWGRRRTAAGTPGSPRSAPDTTMVTARGWLLLLLLLLGASAGLGEGHPLLVLSPCCPRPGDTGNAMGGHGEGGHRILLSRAIRTLPALLGRVLQRNVLPGSLDLFSEAIQEFRPEVLWPDAQGIRTGRVSA